MAASKAKKRRLDPEFAEEAHDDDLAIANLKELDPQFHDYLRQNDKALFDFLMGQQQPEDEEKEEKQEKAELPIDESSLENVPVLTLKRWTSLQREWNFKRLSTKQITLLVQMFDALIHAQFPPVDDAKSKKVFFRVPESEISELSKAIGESFLLQSSEIFSNVTPYHSKSAKADSGATWRVPHFATISPVYRLLNSFFEKFVNMLGSMAEAEYLRRRNVKSSGLDEWKQNELLLPLLRTLGELGNVSRFIEAASQRSRRDLVRILSKLFLASQQPENLPVGVSALQALLVLSITYRAHHVVGSVVLDAKWAKAPPPPEAGPLLQDELLNHVLLEVLTGAPVVAGTWQMSANGLSELLATAREPLGYRVGFHLLQKLGELVPQEKAVSYNFLSAAAALLSFASRAPEKSVRLLLFPLSGVLTAAAKARLAHAVKNSGFLHEVLRLQMQLMAAARLYVPLGGALLEIGSAYAERLTAVETAVLKKKTKKPQSSKTGRDGKMNKDRDFGKHEVMPVAPEGPQFSLGKSSSLPLQTKVTNDPITLVNITGDWLKLVNKHLHLLSHHPAYPEVTFTFILQLKRILKQLKNDTLRQQGRRLVQVAEEVSVDIQKARLTLDPQKVAGPDSNLFVIGGAAKLDDLIC